MSQPFRIPNYKAHEAIAELRAFQGSSFRGGFEFDGSKYVVYSYWTKMLEVDVATGEVEYNARKYSRTTTKHQNTILRGLAMRGVRV
jgi:hypothetical protein